MKKCLKILPLLLMVFITGCMGPHASFTETLQDTFLFTSASDLAPNEHRSIVLTRPYQYKSGMITYSLPAGRYIAHRKHKTGYFYYAPTLIKTQNNFFYPYQSGIYLDNTTHKGYLFGTNPAGDDRPIRGSTLPNGIYQYIKR